MRKSNSLTPLKPQTASLLNGAQVFIFDHKHNNWLKLSNAQPVTALIGCNGTPSDRLFNGTKYRNQATVFTIQSNGSAFSPITVNSQVSFSSSDGNLGNNNCGTPTQAFFSTTSGNTDVINWVLSPVNSGGNKVIQCFAGKDFIAARDGGYRANNLFFTPSNIKNTYVGFTDAGVTYQGTRYFALWNEQNKNKAGHFELFLASPTCSLNSNCSSAGLPNNFCYQGVCVPEKSLSDDQILTVCQNQGNVSGTECVGWANSLSDNSTTRNLYSSSLSDYCHQQYLQTKKVPLNGPCVCLTAANDLHVQKPECFFPGCSSQGQDVFLTNEQKQFVKGGNCSGECSIVINCVGDNVQCQYDQNNFCNYCKNDKSAGSICGGSAGPSKWKKYWEDVKNFSEKYKYYIVAVLSAILILAIVAVVLKKSKK